jgi:hypothetical protein
MIGTEAATIRRRLIMVAAAIILAIDIATLQISTEH